MDFLCLIKRYYYYYFDYVRSLDAATISQPKESEERPESTWLGWINHIPTTRKQLNKNPSCGVDREKAQKSSATETLFHPTQSEWHASVEMESFPRPTEHVYQKMQSSLSMCRARARSSIWKCRMHLTHKLITISRDKLKPSQKSRPNHPRLWWAQQTHQPAVWISRIPIPAPPRARSPERGASLWLRDTCSTDWLLAVANPL